MPLNARVRVSGVGGARGPAGRGITDATVDDTGHLILTFSDDTTEDAGLVVGANGTNGTNGSNGGNGAAGRGIASASIDGSGNLTLTYTDSSSATVGHVVGSNGTNGTNGTNGRDGTDGAKGDTGATGSTGPTGASGLVWRSVWSSGTTYAANDAVSYGGSSWFATAPVTGTVPTSDPSDTPPTPNSPWALLSLHGAQGQQGVPGSNGSNGTNGTDGRDGTDGVDGTDGSNGNDGADGLGIASVTIDGGGDLHVTYTDSSSVNVGHVVGSNGTNGTNGTNGSNGAAGRGITGVTVNGSSHLIVHYTDSTTDDLGALPDGGGGGGPVDVSMPVPSDPFLFNSHGMNGIGWDGKDVDGNPMPVGFQRISIQKQANSYAADYTSIVSLDVSAVDDTNPYAPDGFVLDGTFQVSGNMVALGDSVGDFLPLAITPNNASSAHVDAGSDRVKVSINVENTTGTYVLLNFDDVTDAHCSGVLLFLSTGIAEVAAITNGSIGTVGIISFSNPDSVGPYSFSIEDGLVTAYDGSDVELGSTTTLGSAGTQCGFALAGGAGGTFSSFSVEAKTVTLGEWEEVAGLSTGGAALVAVSGAVRFVAVNTVGSTGSPSGSTSIAYPAPPPHTIANQTDVNFNNLAQYDLLFYDGTEWTNAQPLFTHLQELELTNPSAGDFLRQNSENGDWINATSPTEGTQDTVGTAGGASSLPEAPATYLQIKGPDGTVYAVPAYPLS